MNASQLIVIEGIEGSGTSTQCQLLVEELRRKHPHREVLSTSQPMDPTLARRVAGWVDGTTPGPGPLRSALLAFALDRQIHVDTVVTPALLRGAIVVCNRYTLSTWAYHGHNEDASLIEELERYVPVPDLMVVLQSDPHEIAARNVTRSTYREAYTRDVDTAIAANLAFRNPPRTWPHRNVVHVESGPFTMWQTHEAVVRAVNAALKI